MGSEINSTQLPNVYNCVIRWGWIKPWHNKESVYSKIITLYTGWLLLLQRKLALNILWCGCWGLRKPDVSVTDELLHFNNIWPWLQLVRQEFQFQWKLLGGTPTHSRAFGERQVGARTTHADTHSLGGRGSSTRWYRWMSWRTEGSERTGGPLTQLPEQRTQNTGGIVL